MRDINKPQVVYAYAILLDNKIENWKVTSANRNSIYNFGLMSPQNHILIHIKTDHLIHIYLMKIRY